MIDFEFISEHADFTELVNFFPISVETANAITSTQWCSMKLRTNVQWYICKDTNVAAATMSMNRWRLAEEVMLHRVATSDDVIGLIAMRRPALIRLEQPVIYQKAG